MNNNKKNRPLDQTFLPSLLPVSERFLHPMKVWHAVVTGLGLIAALAFLRWVVS